MYCPKCGVQNIPEAKFCRLCGMAFQTLAKPSQPLPMQLDYGRSLRPLFIGLGFLIIALISIFSRTGFFWWMLFPAIVLLRRGIRRLVRMRQAQVYSALPQQAGSLSNNTPQQMLPASYSDVRVRPTGELMPPPSVTENTTRLLEEDRAAS
jgi:zinc-ribbon domain